MKLLQIYFKDTMDKQQGIHGRKLINQNCSQQIINIVQASSATDDRRRTETLPSLTTLDDLHQELTNLAFKLSRLTVYL